jgi:release factor glutamine methyltransferase
VKELIAAATERLRAAGVASPEHDARALAAHVIGCSLTQLPLHDTLDEQAYDELVARRAARVPLQHLTGSVGFRWIELEVGPGVFVPRPETESVVQWAVDRAQPGWLLVDLCAGSGTSALSLADEVEGAVVHAVEVDPAAAVWTRRNAERLGTGVQVHVGSVEGCLPELDGAVDLVASNPPYVAENERHLPDPEVIDHDPEIALFAGADGLDVIRLVEKAARRLLKPGGLVVVEHSDRQGRTAPEVFEQAGGWAEIEDHQDLTGRDRFVTARWAGSAQPGLRQWRP